MEHDKDGKKMNKDGEKIMKSSNSNSDASRTANMVFGILAGATVAVGAAYLFMKLSERKSKDQKQKATCATCIICENKIQRNDEIVFECNHRAHKDCIQYPFTWERFCPLASCNVTELPDVWRQKTVPESLHKDSNENIFWKTFFRIMDPELEEKYSDQVYWEGSFITWDFWIGAGSGNKSEQYRQVLNKATSIVRDEPKDWEVDSVEKLFGLARSVRDERQIKLLDDGSQKYMAHLDVLMWWNDLHCAIENLLKKLRSKTDGWCTVTQKKRNRRRN